MGKQVDQGTRQESRIVKVAKSIGRNAERLAKRGQKHEADVRIDGLHMRPLLAWENWVKPKSGKRRRAVRMVVMYEDDFWKMVDMDTHTDVGWYVQAKSTQTLSVRKILEGLKDWVIENG